MDRRRILIGVNSNSASSSSIYSQFPMYFEALEDNFYIIINKQTGSYEGVSEIQYSVDECQTWNTLTSGYASKSVMSGKRIYVKNSNLPASVYGGVCTFICNKQCNVAGNIMSLIYGDNYQEQYSFPDISNWRYSFSNLFFNNTYIINAKDLILPATTLVDGCYDFMFYGCTSLTTAPALPATTIAGKCYNFMFYGCTSLTTAPALPAMTLENNCYEYMFYGCTSLTTAPALPATTLANSCYKYMFQGCTSLTTASALPAMTLENNCYEYMFGNTGLTTAPELPATTLAESCYKSMFSSCTNLTTAPEELPATTLAESCYESMFSSCTNLTTAPELPAPVLVKDCYNLMFIYCWKLNYIKAMFITNPYNSSTGHYDYTNAWVSAVPSTGTFVKNKNATWNVTGKNGIPSGWTVNYENSTAKYYAVDLNSEWKISSSVANPSKNSYDGVYESYYNTGYDGTAATMYVYINGLENFKLYIRSYAESNYDYVMVSQLDQDINNDTSYSNSTLVKDHTRGSQNAGETISSYKLVEYTGIDKGNHKITIVYRKDGSDASGDDKGYVLIPKNQ